MCISPIGFTNYSIYNKSACILNDLLKKYERSLGTDMKDDHVIIYIFLKIKVQNTVVE